jgi:hypothetical protein
MAYKKIILRRDTASNWTSANPTLSGGEVGIETDTLKMKLGNGSTAWTSLGYYAPPSIDEVGDVTITSASSGQFLKWNGTAWVNDTIDLGTDTAGSYVSSLVAGTGVTLSNNSGETATPTIAIGQAVGTTDNVTFSDVTVSGNLTVSGTTTTLNTETLTVNDNIIVLNNNATGAPSENAGIEVERGSSTNVQLRWNETTDIWEATVNGSVYSPIITELTLENRLGQEHWHRPVNLATNAILPQTPTYSAGTTDADGGTGISATLTGTSNARLVVDGVNASTGNRILVKNQVEPRHNGIYTVTVQGSAGEAYILTRSLDMNGSVAGQITMGESVSVHAGDNNYYQQFSISSTGSGTNSAHVIGTDNIAFVQYTGTAAFNAGNGLTTTGNTLNVVTADSARIAVSADSIDLAPITQSDNSTSAGLSFVSSVTRDGYGRVTGVTTRDALLTLGTNTTGNYVESLVAGTGVTLTNNSGETATPTVAIGQAVGTGDNVTFVNLNLNGNIVFEGATANEHETTLVVAEPTADRTVTIPDATGTVALTSDLTPYAPLASPTLTGTPTLPTGTIATTQTAGNNSTAVATTAYVDAADALKANLASPTFTGTPTLPTGTIATTQSAGNNSTAVATTAYVDNQASSAASSAASALTVDGLSDTTITSAALGQFLKYSGSAWVNDAVDLGTDTTGDYVATITGGTGVTSTAATTGEGTTHSLSIGQAVGTTDNVTFAGVTADNIKVGVTGANEIDTVSGDLTIDSAGGTVTIDDNLTVTGNLTVSGTTTSVNTETLTVDDNIIVLNNNASGAPSENAGIEVERGSSTNVVLRWNETSDKWEATNDGTVYGNLVTTADSGTITSTMIADGTIVNADINSSAAIAYSKLNLGTSIVNADVSASAAIAYSKLNLGTSIVNSDIGTSAAIDLGKLADVSTSAQTASYTLVLGDKNKVVEMGVGTGNNLTVPLNASVAFPVGSQINILQTGAGQTTVVATGGVTINATPGLKMRAQWSYATLIKRAENTWVLVGDISA